VSDNNEKRNIVLYVSHIKKYFDISSGLKKSKGKVRALDDVTFSLYEGETIGVVGETGCGKTTLGRSLLRLIEPTAGDVYVNLPQEIMNSIINLEQRLNEIVDQDNVSKEDKNEQIKEVLKELGPLRKKYSLTKIHKREMKEYRKLMQPVFQDPYSSLDPRMLVKDIIAEPMKLLTKMSSQEIFKRTLDIIQEIGLSEDHLYRFPHEFSGGQRQRIGIARSLVIDPKVLVLDEPTSALDVSVQAQILNLMRSIQQERNISFIFISHHLSVIRMMADKVAVMYLGKAVEIAETNALFTKMLHPYTRALLSAIPIPDPKTKINRIILEGEIPSPSNPPNGCHFHPRCPVAMKNCGWSAQDLAQPIREMLDPFRNPESESFPRIIRIVTDNDENKIEIDFEDILSEPQESVRAINNLIQKESRLKGGIKFLAIDKVEVISADKIVITFIKYDVPKLKEVSKGHFVSCLIYEDTGQVKRDEVPNAEILA
jgi:oligopeptide/dipeptide ABC transporter ATP-binding protein